MSSETYTLGYGKGSVGLMSLRTAESHAGFFLRKLGKGMSLLDIGCGPGTVTVGFAEAVHPGEVIGAELELEQTQPAASEAQKRGLNLRFESADIYTLPYPDGTFDAVFLSAVLGNLQNPANGLREVLRVLKPGGFVGVKEFDHSGNITFPDVGFLTRVEELYNRLRIENGHDPDSGRKVRLYLHQAGFTGIEALATYQNTTPPPGTTGSPIMEAIVREEWGPKFVELGWASAEEVEGWIAESAVRTTGEEDFSATAWIEALAYKPDP